MRTHRAGFALAAAGAVLALASPALADGGPTWNPDTGPNPSSIGNTLSGVSARTGTDAWTVGWYTEDDPTKSRNVLIARWDGAAWTQVITPESAATDDGLLAVSASAANEAWAVGFSRRLDVARSLTLGMHWDGARWTSVSMPPVGASPLVALDGVVSLGPSSAWAVGGTGATSGNSALIEHWDGSAWSIWPSPTPPAPPGSTESGAVLTAVAAASPSDVWAVGSVNLVSSTTKSRTVPLIEHAANGKEWSIVPGPDLGDAVLRGVAAAGPTDVWAVGDIVDPGTGLPVKALVEHWDGAAWSVVPTPSVFTRGVLTGVTVASPNDVWAVGQAIDDSGTTPVARTLTLHWDGSAWSVADSPNGPTGGTTLNAVSAVPGAGPVWAVGATGDAPIETYILHR